MERYLLVEGEFVAAGLLVTYKPAVGLTLNLGNGGAIIRLSSTKAISAPRPIKKASILNIGRALPSRCSVILPENAIQPKSEQSGDPGVHKTPHTG